jgi:hypothetical protein
MIHRILERRWKLALGKEPQRPQTEKADNDQIYGYDVIKGSWDDQDQNSSQESDGWTYIGNAKGHDCLLKCPARSLNNSNRFANSLQPPPALFVLAGGSEED